MKRFNLYIIDFDGTLIDSYNGLKTFYHQIFSYIGYPVTDEECFKFTKMSLQEAFYLKTHSTDPKLIQKFTDKCNAVVATRELLKYNIPFKDTFPFINYIKDNNIPCVLVTGNVMHHIQMVYDNLGIPNFTIFNICSSDIKKQKPDPEGLLLSLERFNYQGDKKDVCYIGDAYNDYLAAKAAGITPIMIDRLNEFQNLDDAIIIHDLMELFND